MQNKILQVAVDVPLRRCFDYLAGDHQHIDLAPGTRLRVPFGKRKQQIGVLLGCTDKSAIAPGKLKSIDSVVDPMPLFDEQHLALLDWASRYYQHPVGEVIFTALPGLLRQGKAAEKKTGFLYRLTDEGKQSDLDQLRRAPKQKQLLQILADTPEGLSQTELGGGSQRDIHTPLRALLDKGLVEKVAFTPRLLETAAAEIELNPDQLAAVSDISRELNGYHAHLLEGITGSGKTEVYIEIIRQIIAARKQVLILVPEIGLTPQFLERLQQRLPAAITLLHSGLGNTQRLQNWLAARDGEAQVIVGTRSAVWTPLKNPGLFIVDEEHDLSYKQDTGFRYSARDVAIMRAQMAAVPVILGSATPSLESICNVQTGKFQHSRLSQRAGGSRSPEIKLINLQNRQITGAFSKSLLQALEDNLEAGNQSLLFLNRRGYAPAIFCHTCGWIAGCARCSTNMTWHKAMHKLVCHHCDKRQALPTTCPECDGQQLMEVGHGTQRISQTIAECFPQAKVLRIDRDSTRRRDSMHQMLAQIESGEAQILVGTQMLAKGHHFPAVTLVGIVDADSGLLSADFRATERMAQLITQVSGRAGRADRPGTVYLQTHYPDHPLLQTLLRQGYDAFARSLLEERRQTDLPPYVYIALLRAESQDRLQADKFLRLARDRLAKTTPAIEIAGPFIAPMEKKQNRYRYQLLLQTQNRNHFKSGLGDWLLALENAAGAKKVRWSLDIDPQDMI
ncbi:MAG: primosomal protein N' [Gammaproteobacteria bacterium]